MTWRGVDFADFYADAHPRLVAAVTGFCGDPEIGRDAADEAMVRAFERWERVGRMESPAGWVMATGMNQARRILRRRSRLDALLRRSRPPAAVEGPAAEVWQIVGDLPERQRQAIVLRHLADLTEPDIAAAMGVTRGTVSSTLRAAHAALRSRLTEDLEPQESGS